MTTDDLEHRRRLALGAGYETFYDRPLHLVRGEGVHLFDANGRNYLDCYNNVPSVGHCHPRVVEAIATQAAKLNTHTRYLHDNVVQLAERLGSKLAGDLSACWLTCTGTEANDLAVQIARTVTGHHGVVVFDGAYHGNSTLVRALSPDDCPADERPDWVITVPPPNRYRGVIAGVGGEGVANKCTQLVADACAELDRRGHGVAAVLVDCSWDANGVLVTPEGLMPQVAAAIRSRGGLVIADEVQAGYCRLGAWWGHELDGLAPDIVTMGKPMGGGHPVAACVTTPDISSEFGRQRSYFNTFGGNPVSAAAALAVLDVIDDEGLLDNAASTGRYLGEALAELSSRHDIIGTVSGRGLFWGIDLVANPASHEPIDDTTASAIVSDIVSEGVLMGTVGPHRNIIKVRPPLPFSPNDADQAVAALDVVLSRH